MVLYVGSSREKARGPKSFSCPGNVQERLARGTQQTTVDGRI